MTKQEMKELEEKGIKVTICKPAKAKGSGGQNFGIVKAKFHAKSNRPHKHSAPSSRVVSGIYGNNQQLNGKQQHRGLNPLAAQQNQPREQF